MSNELVWQPSIHLGENGPTLYTHTWVGTAPHVTITYEMISSWPQEIRTKFNLTADQAVELANHLLAAAALTHAADKIEPVR
jgi:hypothetical protein